MGPGNDHEHGGACQLTQGRSFTQLAHCSAHEPHLKIRSQRSTLTCSAPTNPHYHTLPGRDANLESISTAALALAPAPAWSRASRSPVSPKACNPNERQYTGFAHGIHLGKTKIRKAFDGIPFDGVVASFHSPWFKVYYTDGDAEDLKGCELVQDIVWH